MEAFEYFRSSVAPSFADEPALEAEYRRWVADLKLGVATKNELFLTVYAANMVRLDAPRRTYEELMVLIESVSGSGHNMKGLWRMAADALILDGDFHGARQHLPRPRLGSKDAGWVDADLTLAHWLGFRITGEQMVALAGPKVTKVGREYFELVVTQLEVQARAYEEHNGVDILDQWAASCRKYRFMLFGWAWLRDRPMIMFSEYEPAVTWVRSRLREAENVVREEHGLPRVGEGWVEETRLYYALKHQFHNEEVLQHASPPWLGTQHLDVFFPERRVAVEYHGIQHDEPVAYFGGPEGYERTVERDRLKARKCVNAGVALLEVRPGYVLSDVVASVIAASTDE